MSLSAIPITGRCVECGCPETDHIPLRYVLRVWARHHFWALINKLGRA